MFGVTGGFAGVDDGLVGGWVGADEGGHVAES